MPTSLLGRIAAVAACTLLLAGCGGGSGPPPGPTRAAAPQSPGAARPAKGDTAKRDAAKSASNSPGTSKPGKRPSGMFQEPGPAGEDPAAEPGDFDPKAAAPPGQQGARPPKRRSLADLLEGDPEALAKTPDYLIDPHDGSGQYLPDLPRMAIDEARAAAAGIRKLMGKHLTLWTDLPSGPEVDGLPGVFDLAFPQWCRYLGVDPEQNAGWRLTGMLIGDKKRFRQAGLMPDDLPPFPHGYARNFEFWLYEQPSGYYRRHLLLHEGTHGFMNTLLGSCGPPWYMEGIAELLATHRWQDGRLTLGHFPATREEVPMWGRVKIVHDAFAAGEGRHLREVVEYSRRAHRENEPYGWCWAAAAFLDGHPRYQKRFRELPKLVRYANFSDRFFRLYADDWEALAEEWEVFVTNIQYGYDVARNAIDFAPGQPLPEGGAAAVVAADRGWQTSGLRLEAGRAYRLAASGRYQVADQPQIWWCEPNGVSIRYWDKQPLGILLCAVRPDKYAPPKPSALTRPIVVGLGATLRPAESGTLYFRVNDSPAELADNAGSLTVKVQPGE